MYGVLALSHIPVRWLSCVGFVTNGEMVVATPGARTVKGTWPMIVTTAGAVTFWETHAATWFCVTGVATAATHRCTVTDELHVASVTPGPETLIADPPRLVLHAEYRPPDTVAVAPLIVIALALLPITCTFDPSH